nr:hypothetical protein [Tanacetum cinerariifolium]
MLINVLDQQVLNFETTYANYTPEAFSNPGFSTTQVPSRMNRHISAKGTMMFSGSIHVDDFVAHVINKGIPRFDDPQVWKDMKSWSFKVIKGDLENPSVVVNLKGAEKTFPPEELPFMEAGTIAGLNVFHLLNKPTASAIVYDVDIMAEKQSNKDVTVLVFDLGGGTFWRYQSNWFRNAYTTRMCFGYLVHMHSGISSEGMLLTFKLREWLSRSSASFMNRLGRSFRSDELYMGSKEETVIVWNIRSRQVDVLSLKSALHEMMKKGARQISPNLRTPSRGDGLYILTCSVKVGEWHLNTVGKFQAVKSLPLPSGDVFTVYEDPANTALSSQCHYHQQKTMPMKQENNLSHEL